MPDRAKTIEQDRGRAFVPDIVLNSVKILDIGEKQAECVPAFMRKPLMRRLREMTCSLMVLVLVLVLALAPTNSHADDFAGARAGSFGQPTVSVQLAFRFDERGRVDVALNGIPLRSRGEDRMRMTCPPPPNSCAPLVGIMLLATVFAVAVIDAARDRER